MGIVTLIFSYIRGLRPFWGFTILNFNILGGGGGGFRKINILWDMENLLIYIFFSGGGGGGHQKIGLV